MRTTSQFFKTTGFEPSSNYVSFVRDSDEGTVVQYKDGSELICPEIDGTPSYDKNGDEVFYPSWQEW